MEELRIPTKFGDIVAVPYEGQDEKGAFDGIQIYLDSDDPAYPDGRTCCVVVEEGGHIVRWVHDEFEEIMGDPYILA